MVPLGQPLVVHSSGRQVLPKGRGSVGFAEQEGTTSTSLVTVQMVVREVVTRVGPRDLTSTFPVAALNTREMDSYWPKCSGMQLAWPLAMMTRTYPHAEQATWPERWDSACCCMQYWWSRIDGLWTQLSPSCHPGSHTGSKEIDGSPMATRLYEISSGAYWHCDP